MNTIKITTTQNIELEYDLASLGDRIAAYLIDLAVILAYCIAFSIVITSSGTDRFLNMHVWYYVLFYLPIMLYDLAFELFMNGQSIGKRQMKIKVISIDGAQPTLGQYLLRWIFRPVDITVTAFMCGIISIALSENKQRLGDIIAGTALIKTDPRTKFQQTLYFAVDRPDYQVTFPEVTNFSDQDMELLKEVLNTYTRGANYMIVARTAEKINETLQINSNMEPVTLIKVLLSDYNYLMSRFEV